MPGLINRRGKRRWRASVMVNGQQRQKLFPDATKESFRAAVEWEAAAKREMENTLTATASWTLLDWSNAYLDHARERFVDKTYWEKRNAFAGLIQLVGPDTVVEGLSVSACLKLLRDRAKARSGNAANKDRKNLSAAWDWGFRYLDDFPDIRNPFKAVDKFSEVRKPRYVPPEADFWAVYEAVEGQDKVMLLTFLHLAARRGEVFNLTWQDVDFHSGRVRLWTRKRKDGTREYDWLPLTEDLRAALRTWWAERPVKEALHVFVCLEHIKANESYYGQPFKCRQRFMDRVCRRAGVKPFGFHAIRHLTASILYAKGYPLAVIQAVLRHQSPTTTQRYLRKLGIEEVRNGLDEALKGPAEVIPLKKMPLESRVPRADLVSTFGVQDPKSETSGAN